MRMEVVWDREKRMRRMMVWEGRRYVFEQSRSDAAPRRAALLYPISDLSDRHCSIAMPLKAIVHCSEPPQLSSRAKVLVPEVFLVHVALVPASAGVEL